LIAALKEEGFEVQWFDGRKDIATIDFDNIFGLIANTCSRRLFNWLTTRHWFSLKKFGEKFYNLDSALQSPIMFQDKEEFQQFLRDICKDKEAQLLIITRLQDQTLQQ